MFWPAYVASARHHMQASTSCRMVKKLKTSFAAGLITQLSTCVQPIFGGLSSLFSHGYLLLPLLSRLYFFQDVLEHLKTRCRWMTHDMVLGPVMQVIRKGLDGTIVRGVIPPLEQQAVAILPMMTILADFEAPLDFDRPFGHLDQVPIGEQHAIPVMYDLFEFSISDRPPHNLHVMHERTGAQQGIKPTQIGLNHASVAARNVARRSWYSSTSS